MHKLAHICSTVRQTVVETLETTISKMKCRPQDSIAAATFLSNWRPFDLAFTCSLNDPESHSDHLMKVGEGESAECVLDHVKTNLKREQLLWFTKVREYMGIHLGGLLCFGARACANSYTVVGCICLLLG